jgi:hypothetical protein
MNQEPVHKDFFLSYNSADTGWAEWIAWVLEEKGFAVHVQARDFRPGNNFVHEMQYGAALAERTIALLSPGYLASRFTASEWYAAFSRDPTGEKRLLIPVRVQTCDPTGLLGPIIHCDLVGVTDEARARELVLDAVRSRRGGSAGKPDFPGGVPARPTGRSGVHFPGGAPALWNPPRRRNPRFTGRDALLATVRSSLRDAGSPGLTALSGLGGIGKTQIALEFVYRFASDYEVIWWFRADRTSLFMEDLHSLVRCAGLDVDGGAGGAGHAAPAERDHAVLAQLRDWLTGRRWLFVLDNAVDVAVSEWMLHGIGSGGHVLITSRDPNWRRLGTVVPVPRFLPEDAARFLIDRSGLGGGSEPLAAARALAAELGELPLALEQAAAYMEEHGKTTEEYLALFRKHRLKLLNRGAEGDDRRTIAAAWEVSLEAIRAANPTAIELIRVLSLFAPDRIPIQWIRGHADGFSPGLAAAAADDLDWEEVVGALYRHSLLVLLDHDSVAVHRLVQDVVHAGMEPEHANRLLDAVWSTMSGEFPNLLRHRLVNDGQVHGLPGTPARTPFQLIGYNDAATALDFVAVCAADGFTEAQISRCRAEFFDIGRNAPRELGLEHRGRNPSGLLCFVFVRGCPEHLIPFIEKQSEISHAASAGGVMVSWTIDVRIRRISTHVNPISVFPPVIIRAQGVHPGLGYFESLLQVYLPNRLPAAEPEVQRVDASPAPADPGEPGRDRVRLLFVGNNLSGSPLDVEREVSYLEQELRRSRHRDRFEVTQTWFADIDRFLQGMLDVSPTIVHFSGSGAGAGLVFRDGAGDYRQIPDEALARLFEMFKDTVQCVVLNAIYDEGQARAISRHIPWVVGTRFTGGDNAAQAFFRCFYKAIGAGKDVPFAFELGRACVRAEGYENDDSLVLVPG